MAEPPLRTGDDDGSSPMRPARPSSRPDRGEFVAPETAYLLHGWNDLATEVLLYAALFFASWGWGATEFWCIRILNGIGVALGVTWMLRRAIARAENHPPARWGDPLLGHESEPDTRSQRRRRNAMRVLGWVSWAILGYTWIGLLNSRERDGAWIEASVSWLPHTYDSSATVWALQCYAALAMTFWAGWDWMRGKTRNEQESYFEKLPERLNQNLPFIPERASRFLWFLFGNGAVLALASILQRLSGTKDLLWIMPSIIGDATFHFGPFNYRANGAQYFNLVWPVCLAFWWLGRVRHQAGTQLNERAGTGVHAILFPLGALMGACPIISTNRVGALLSIAAGPLIYGLLAWDARKRNSKHRLSLHGLFACLLGLGLYLGWIPLEARLERVGQEMRVDPAWAKRKEQYQSTARLIRDHWIFGTGPNAYSTVHQFHLGPRQVSYKYAHSDWLQTVAEWGVAGSLLVFVAMGICVTGAFWIGLGEPVLIRAVGVGLGMVLVHGMVDFPLQIHGILLTFTLLCAMTLALPPRHESS